MSRDGVTASPAADRTTNKKGLEFRLGRCVL